jgi:hypothetical protein
MSPLPVCSSVGEAVKSWADHVRRALASPQPSRPAPVKISPPSPLSKTSPEGSIQVCDEKSIPTNLLAKSVGQLGETEPIESANDAEGESARLALKTTGTAQTNTPEGNAEPSAARIPTTRFPASVEPPTPRCNCYTDQYGGIVRCWREQHHEGQHISEDGAIAWTEPAAPPASDRCKAEAHGCPGSHLTCDLPEGHDGKHEMWVPPISEGEEPTRHQWEAASEVPPRPEPQLEAELRLSLVHEMLEILERNGELKNPKQYVYNAAIGSMAVALNKFIQQRDELNPSLTRSRVLAEIEKLKAQSEQKRTDAYLTRNDIVACLHTAELSLLDTLKRNLEAK